MARTHLNVVTLLKILTQFQQQVIRLGLFTQLWLYNSLNNRPPFKFKSDVLAGTTVPNISFIPVPLFPL